MNACAEQDLHAILNRSMRDTTRRFAGIQLQDETAAPSDNICTVHTVLEGGHRAVLLLCADTALLVRLARTIMRRESVTPREVEDVATEYFNIICGRVAAGLFQAAHISSRFQCPRFRTGRYLPQTDSARRCVLSYSSGNNERIQLIYMGPLP